MNSISTRSEKSFQEAVNSIRQYESSQNWKMAEGPDKGVISLNVFGTAGNRHSILIIEKDNLITEYAGRDGNWLLSQKDNGKLFARFNLEWAVEAAGSGCLVLCGREVPVPFISSA